MKTIFKYPTEITDEQIVMMPKDAHALSTQIQNGRLCIWALVDTDNELVERRVRVFGTGNPVDLQGNWQFLGTVQERVFVWHIFIEV